MVGAQRVSSTGRVERVEYLVRRRRLANNVVSYGWRTIGLLLYRVDRGVDSALSVG